MMAQSRAESTRDTYNYGQYINQFPPNTIKVIREFERIQKKICRHKMSIMFNEICINEEMLPKFTYLIIYKQIYSTSWTLTCITTPGQSGPGSNDNEEVIYTLQSFKTPHHKMQLCVILRIPLFFGGVFL